MEIPGYSLGSALDASPWVSVYAGTRLSDGTTVLIKTPRAGSDPVHQRERLSHEHGILVKLNGDVRGIPRLLEYQDLGSGCALVLAGAPECRPLKSVVRGRPLDPAKFLEIAMNLVSALDGVHGAKLAHRALNAPSILVNPKTAEVMLTEFGSAGLLDERAEDVRSQPHLPEWLPYLSPEQTGRMNRGVDYRTDFYSLGVVFFEMLTGRLPFDFPDPPSLIHAHIARVPPSVAELQPSVPRMICAIVARLLSKSPDDRYQSAYGLRRDLELCRDALRCGDPAAVFPLGAGDVRATFRIPAVLYGRDAETAKLRAAFERVSWGASGAVFVCGPPGIGKSALVRELDKHVTGRKGHFVSGKFDQFNRGMPYSALGAAFGQLAREWLSEPEERLGTLRRALASALGTNGQAILDIVPEVAAVIGPQPPLPELGLSEAEARLNIAFASFVRALSGPDHPLVLFIDDLQWADAATLKLLQALLVDSDIKHLLVAGCYRPDGLGADHPLLAMMDQLAAHRLQPELIHLLPLEESAVQSLVAETLHVPAASAAPLAALVNQRTRGNPFSIHVYLTALWEQGMFKFDGAAGGWMWDLEAIRQQPVTEDIGSLMGRKVNSQPPATLRLLQIAACAGNRFEVSLIASLAGKTLEEAADALAPAVRDGLVQAAEAGRGHAEERGSQAVFRFLHDRIQAAAAATLAPAEVERIHLEIARELCKKLGPEPLRDDRLFDIVNHLNIAEPLVKDAGERMQAARLDLQAACRARSGNASGSALACLEAGERFAGPGIWKRNHELALGLQSELAHVAFLIGDNTMRERASAEILAHARTMSEKLVVYELRILAASQQMKYPEAVAVGLEALTLLGAPLPRAPGKLRVGLELVRTRLALLGRSTAALADLPPMTDAAKLAAMRIMMHVSSAAYFAEPNLFPVIVFRMVRLSLKHGNAPLSAFAYACYGLVLCGVVGDLERGYAFGSLSLRILEKTGARDLAAKVVFLQNVFIRHWKEPLINSLEPFLDASRVGMDAGDLEFSSYSLYFHGACSLLSGTDFATLEQRLSHHLAITQKHRMEKAAWLIRLLQFQVFALKGDTAGVEKLRESGWTEETAAQHWEQARDHTSLGYLHALGAMRCHLLGDASGARTHARAVERHYDSALGQTFVPLYQFYEVLSLCARGMRLTLRERWRIRRHLGRLKKWAEHCPANYAHKYLLARAEADRAAGRHDQAAKGYSQALHEARRHGMAHEAALVAECAAQMFLSCGQPEIAAHYLSTAVQGYKNWGATRKADQLLSAHRDLIRRETPGSPVQNIAEMNSRIDLEAITQSCRMLSGEIVTERLVARIVELVMTNAGAGRALFIRLLEHPVVLAEARTGEGAPRMLPAVPIQTYEEVPGAVINYVIRTRDHLVLENAAHDPAFQGDPYIRRRAVQSVLCVPLFQQGSPSAIIYLENNLTSAAFTRDRVAIVTMLAAQAAISLENAELLGRLENKVQERTGQLQEERDRSDQLLQNILPRTIAEELKIAGKVQPKLYESATIIFADIVGFTRIAESHNPHDLLARLNAVFFKFDEISERHGLEKLKHIGDAYMCAGGLPEPSATHAVDACLAALEFMEFIEKLSLNIWPEQHHAWGLRVGIHSGPLIAGVIGYRKFAYDVWGDTVNIASRMESSGIAGHVNISAATQLLVDEFFITESRGMITAKNKGEMEMFFLNGLRPEFSDGGQPNSKFQERYNQLRSRD